MSLNYIEQKMVSFQEKDAVDHVDHADFRQANNIAFRAVLSMAQTSDPELNKYFSRIDQLADRLKSLISNKEISHENTVLVLKDLLFAIKQKEIKTPEFHE